MEFALTAPILFTLLFGCYELSRAYMIMHTVESSCYEGARVGIVPGATASEVEDSVNQVLATVGIQNADISVTPSNLDNITDTVAVTVEVDFEDNLLFSPLVLNDLEFTRTCELLRELTD